MGARQLAEACVAIEPCNVLDKAQPFATRKYGFQEKWSAQDHHILGWRVVADASATIIFTLEILYEYSGAAI